MQKPKLVHVTMATTRGYECINWKIHYDHAMSLSGRFLRFFMAFSRVAGRADAAMEQKSGALQERIFVYDCRCCRRQLIASF